MQEMGLFLYTLWTIVSYAAFLLYILTLHAHVLLCVHVYNSCMHVHVSVGLTCASCQQQEVCGLC